MNTTVANTTLKGGEFLIKETEANDIFIPEEWNEEQLMIAKSCQDFLAQNVWPNLDRIDAQEEGLMVDLLNKAGELGLLSPHWGKRARHPVPAAQDWCQPGSAPHISLAHHPSKGWCGGIV
jgi:alkylation response protein AidB-like acyl-CoA dehydrogenase